MHRKSILDITGSQNQVKVTKGHQVQIFKNSKITFLSSYAQKSILDITGSQNQVRVTKGHKVQIFKKCNFELLYTQKMHFSHHGRLKSGQGHQVQIFKKSIFEFLCTEKDFWHHGRSQKQKGSSLFHGELMQCLVSLRSVKNCDL